MSISNNSKQHELNPDTYDWTYHAMKALFKVFNLTIRTHGNQSAWQDGDIFLFNHFARFEAFIPQYLIYEKTKLYSRSIASKELFADNLFGRYLSNLGGIPNDTESLMYDVSKDIFHNHKLVAFPEGGIVKDRRTINSKGQHEVYSRANNQRRKLHTGPAVIALAITIFKKAVRELHKNSQYEPIQAWAYELGFSNIEQLVIACEKPTIIVPCNITFYPLRIGDNALKDSVQFFMKNLHKRLSEELLIEGNFLLKNTDMDIHLGKSIIVEDYWTKFESVTTQAFVNNAELSLSKIFNTVRSDDSFNNILFRMSYQRNTKKIRDDYMRTIYANVTINIAHIASSLIMYFLAEGNTHINKKKLHHLIYCSIKTLQKYDDLVLHRTLQNPSIYRNLLMTQSETFNLFLRSAYKANLLESSGAYYNFTEQLTADNDFDSIRLKNPIAVNANEVAPISQVQEAIKASLKFKLNKKLDDFAKMLNEDEQLEYKWDFAQYNKSKHQDINQQQTILSQSALPFQYTPNNPNGECVVLVHGLLATPGELKPLGIKLQALGYNVIACRLKGHGTSPWDLHERTWQDWYQSVRQSIKIAHCYSTKVHLVGFSSGALLALMSAANRNFNIQSVTACSTPLTFKDPLVNFVKVADVTNKLFKKFSNSEGIMPFKDNSPEHPHLNYQHVPIAAIHQLLILIKKTRQKIKKLHCPTFLLQADNDPVVDPASMEELLNQVPNRHINYEWVSSARHGILYENTDDCQQKVIDFICKQSK